MSSSDDLVGSNDGASAHKRTTDSTGQHDLRDDDDDGDDDDDDYEG